MRVSSIHKKKSFYRVGSLLAIVYVFSSWRQGRAACGLTAPIQPSSVPLEPRSSPQEEVVRTNGCFNAVEARLTRPQENENALAIGLTTYTTHLMYVRARGCAAPPSTRPALHVDVLNILGFGVANRRASVILREDRCTSSGMLLPQNSSLLQHGGEEPHGECYGESQVCRHAWHVVRCCGGIDNADRLVGERPVATC